jgi:hypothetical protein
MKMAIEKAKKYVPLLDEKYTEVSKTSILDSQEEAQYLANANTFLVADRDFDGLADYDRTNGYAKSGINLTWTPYVVDYDRARMIIVDQVDNLEAASLGYLGIASQMMNEKVVPELDGIRIATYAQKAGNTSVDTITTSAQAIAALRKAATKMANKKVPVANRVLYISNTMLGLVEDLDSYKSKAVLDKFGTIVGVSDEEFVNKVNLTSNGFTIPEDAVTLNFLVVSKKSVIQHLTHVAPKIVTPEQNQDADAYKFGYRIVGICDVYKNKKDGIYASFTQEVATTNEDGE